MTGVACAQGVPHTLWLKIAWVSYRGWLSWLVFLSALVAMLGPGLGKIVPSVTLRGQAILGGRIFQGVKGDLSKHKKKISSVLTT